MQLLPGVTVRPGRTPHITYYGQFRVKQKGSASRSSFGGGLSRDKATSIHFRPHSNSTKRRSTKKVLIMLFVRLDSLIFIKDS